MILQCFQRFTAAPVLAFTLLCAAAAQPAAASGLTFACAERNDVYQALAAAAQGDAKRPARFDTAREAIESAAEGSGVLLLADGYPERRNEIAPELFDRAKAKRLRLFVEYPAAMPGVKFGEPRGVTWERGVVASDELGAGLPKMRILALHDCRFLPAEADNPLLVIARVAGYDTAVYGLPDTRFPALFAAPDGTLVATTKLSGFVTGRYAPAHDWLVFWQSVLARLDPSGGPHKLKAGPTVRPAFGKDEPLPADAERASFDRYANWFGRSGLLIAPPQAEAMRKLQASGGELTGPPGADEATGDGSLGMLEGYASQILPDGGQMRRTPIRADCQGEAAAVLALHAKLNGDARSGAVAKNLLDFVYFKSGMCQGVRGDPTHPAYGHIAWGDVAPAWMVANYGDDNARTLLGTMLAAACLKSDAWDAPMLKALLANLRTTGQLGFRGDRIDVPQLERDGWRVYHDSKITNYGLNFEAYPWACSIWAYKQTGDREFLDKTKTAIRMTMEAYPDKWRWGDNMERARFLLPLAWLVRVEDTPEHRAWLKRIAKDLIARQEPCGALPEWLGGTGGGGGHYVVPATNEAYGTTETPLIQENGDPVSDQLYTAGFALLGLHEAVAATGDAELKRAADKLAEYLVRIQIRSDAVPYLDGAWFRAFDYAKWDYWASSADMGWGAWSVEAGWCQTWTGATLALRMAGTSLWDLTADSQIARQMPDVRKQMAVNTGGPWKAPAPATAAPAAK